MPMSASWRKTRICQSSFYRLVKATARRRTFEIASLEARNDDTRPSLRGCLSSRGNLNCAP